MRTRTEAGHRVGPILAATLLFASSAMSVAASLKQVAPLPGCEAALAGIGRHSSTPGYLGVDIRDVSDEKLSALKMKEAHGAEVIRVDHDGPAGKAGVREHDVILQMNGQAIEGEEQMRRMLRETPAGRDVTLVVSRDGIPQTISTKLANRSVVEREAWEQHFTVPQPEAAPSTEASVPAKGSGTGSVAAPANGFFGAGSVSAAATHSKNFFGDLIAGSSYTGAMVEQIGPQLATFLGVPREGVLVHSVDSNSPAATAGLKAGDIVLRANTATMTSTSDWLKVMHENKGKAVTVVVVREKKEQTLTLTPDAKKRSSVTPDPPPANVQQQSNVVPGLVSYSAR